MEMQAEPGAPMSPEELATKRREAFEAWQKSIQPAKDWKAYENTKRLEVFGLLFDKPTRGTNRFDFGNGYKVKLTYQLTYKLGDKELVDPVLGEKVPIETQVEGTLDAIRALGPEAALLADRLVKWEPKLSETEYYKLREDIPIEAEVKKLIESILTITPPGSPQLAIEEPKATS